MGVERGERGERRGDAIPCITGCTPAAMRCKEGHPLDAGTILVCGALDGPDEQAEQ